MDYKWIGAVLIISACGGFGFSLICTHRREEATLRSLASALDYMVSELQAVRCALSLGDAEQLCVSGEDAPVTVVSEDGVRRHINP
jgi:hypothetical protein